MRAQALQEVIFSNVGRIGYPFGEQYFIYCKLSSIQGEKTRSFARAQSDTGFQACLGSTAGRGITPAIERVRSQHGVHVPTQADGHATHTCVHATQATHAQILTLSTARHDCTTRTRLRACARGCVCPCVRCAVRCIRRVRHACMRTSKRVVREICVHESEQASECACVHACLRTSVRLCLRSCVAACERG